MDWSIRKSSELSVRNKTFSVNTFLNQSGCMDSALRLCQEKYFQNKVFRIIVNAPWFMRNKYVAFAETIIRKQLLLKSVDLPSTTRGNVKRFTG